MLRLRRPGQAAATAIATVRASADPSRAAVLPCAVAREIALSGNSSWRPKVWKLDTPLVLVGLVTMAWIADLLWAMKHHTFSVVKPLGAGGYYVLFAIGLTVNI